MVMLAAAGVALLLGAGPEAPASSLLRNIMKTLDTLPNNEPPMANNQPSSHKIGSKLIIATTTVVIIGIVAGILLKNNNNSSQPPQSPSTVTPGVAYYYKTLVDTKLAVGSTTSIEFKRPKEFGLSTKDTTVVKGEYVHTGASVNKQLAVVGGIAAYSKHLIIANNPPVDIAAATQAFNNQQSSEYQAYLKSLGINDFLSAELAHRYFGDLPANQVKLTVQPPKVLTTPNLKQNAWLFSFSAQSDAQPNKTVSGDLVFALGNSTPIYNAYNYIMISTLDFNWQPNNSIWQRVIDSIKITDKKPT